MTEADQEGYSNRVARSIARRRTANYLLSIQQDVDFVKKARHVRPSWPFLANLRAGAWYASPAMLDGTSYFKSMDGHRNAWDFSLIRLNLHVARMAAGAGVILVDCTGNRRKRFPDSMSKTIPIWCAVLQAAVEPEADLTDLLHVPLDVKDERLEILERMPQWVELLRKALPASELIDLAHLLNGKRLRAFWLCPSDDMDVVSAELAALEKHCVVILCISASKVEVGSTSYVQGAGDDEEAWAQHLGLTPQLFWKHAEEFFDACRCGRAFQEVDDLIRGRALEATLTQKSQEDGVVSFIGSTGLCVGDFHGAKPPMVWSKDAGIDAVLNCGGEEHPEMRGDARYCFLPAADEKKHDPLKRWWQEVVLPRSLRFLWRHLKEGRRVLIHCTRGDNRSPAVAAAALAAFFGPNLGPFCLEAGRRFEKSDLRRCLVTVQCYHPNCMVPRRIMQFLNLFFVTEGAGWSQWHPESSAGNEEPLPLVAEAAVLASVSRSETRNATEVLPGIFISGRNFASSLPCLRHLNITHIVNATKEANTFEEEFIYHQVPIEDSRSENLIDVLEPALVFLQEATTKPKTGGEAVRPPKILIHCREGRSRSVAIMLAYMMRFQRLSLDAALEILQQKHPRTKPNAGFIRQLRIFEAAERKR